MSSNSSALRSRLCASRSSDGSRSFTISSSAARCTADGNTSFELWPMLTSSFTCTPSPASVAITSFAFMFEDVPEPVWKTSIGNWSSSSPAAMRSAAAAIRSALSPSSRSRSALTRAAAPLIRPSQRATSTGIGSPETGKLPTAFVVSPPQSSRRVSVSLTPSSLDGSLGRRPRRDVDGDVAVVAGRAERDLPFCRAVHRLVRDLGVLLLELVEEDLVLRLLQLVLVLAVDGLELLVAVAVDDVRRPLVLGLDERHSFELGEAGRETRGSGEPVARARDRAAAGLRFLLRLALLVVASAAGQRARGQRDEQQPCQPRHPILLRSLTRLCTASEAAPAAPTSRAGGGEAGREQVVPRLELDARAAERLAGGALGGVDRLPALVRDRAHA